MQRLENRMQKLYKNNIQVVSTIDYAASRNLDHLIYILGQHLNYLEMKSNKIVEKIYCILDDVEPGKYISWILQWRLNYLFRKFEKIQRKKSPYGEYFYSLVNVYNEEEVDKEKLDFRTNGGFL